MAFIQKSMKSGLFAWITWIRWGACME